MANDNTKKIKEIPAEVEDLARPDWRDPIDRRRIAACLVYVVYQLKKGKEEKLEAWCKLLNFKVNEKITEKIQSNGKERIFGAIFQYVGAVAEDVPFPSKVVAFSGTFLQTGYILGKDFKSNWNAINARHGSMSRVEIGIESLNKCISDSEPDNIWIVGHSLGAAIAMGAVRKIDKGKIDKIEAHFFNPPFFSPRLLELKFFEMLGNGLAALRDLWRSLGWGAPNALDFPMIDDKKLRDLYDGFIRVKGWIPNIYIAKNDPICCSYIRYFEKMGAMYKNISMPLYERMKYLFCFEIFEYRTPWHLLPSAKLFLRDTSIHDISQWWSKILELEDRKYLPPVEAPLP